MARGLRRLAGLALALGLAAGAAQAADAPSAGRSWWTGFLADSRLVALPDERMMHLYCEGQGEPVVVLDSGLGDGATSWAPVQDQIAAKTRVCSYDRAGYGKSSAGPAPRDTKAIVADLAAMLKASGERGPYVLVGHSLASFDVRLFALTHPKDVAGMVLVDPSADWQMKRMGAVAPKLAASTDAAYAGMKPCALSPRPEAYAKLCTLIPPTTPAEARPYLIEVRGPAYYGAMLGEVAVFAETDSQELTDALAAAKAKGGTAPLGSKPLVVLTAGNTVSPGLTPEELVAVRKVWVTMHDEMAGLSTKGVNRIVPESTHYIHQDRPQVVIDAVAEVVDAVRKAPRR
jgi:pimeloyl-ACP methyl ester carboxylesterase